MSDNWQNARSAPLTTLLCGWAVLAFLLFQGAKTPADLARIGYVAQYEIFGGKVHGLITMALLHENAMHIVFNLLWFWMMGGLFERVYGTPRFALFFLTSAAVSSGLQMFDQGNAIGLSGVVYALFGFMWVARAKEPIFGRIAHDGNARMMVGWGILCIVLTYFNILPVANIAHGAGLAFGVLAAGILVIGREWRLSGSFAMATLVAAAVLALLWNPKNIGWHYARIERAMAQKNYRLAESRVQFAMKSRVDQLYCLAQLADIYEAEGRTKEYAEVDAELRALTGQDKEKAAPDLQDR